MKMTIGAEPFDSHDARRLIETLDAHLSSRYSADQRFGPNLKAEHLDLGRFVRWHPEDQHAQVFFDVVEPVLDSG